MALMFDNCKGDGGGSILLSLDSSAHKTVPAPFLTKTYQLIDDSATDHIVSWGDDDTTFVVWRPPEFARDLLPNYFKHSNFSSFVRQLNTYGFRKIVPDRWEFVNEFFRKGEMHLLCEIHRRKTAHPPLPLPQLSLSHRQSQHGHIGVGQGFFPFSGRASISPASESDDNRPGMSCCDSPPFVSSPPAVITTNCGGKSCYIRFSNDPVAALSEDNERLRRSNSMLMLEIAHMKRLYNDIIYFVQNHVKPVTASNLYPSSFLLCSNGNGSNAANAASSLVQKPLAHLLSGYYPSRTTNDTHNGIPSPSSPLTLLEDHATNNKSTNTKLFGVPIRSLPTLSKKRSYPEHSGTAATMEASKARLVQEKDDLGLKLMTPSTS